MEPTTEPLTRKRARETILACDVEVAERLAAGRNRVEIAEQLDISLSTVGRQIGKMYRLTGTYSRTQLIEALRERDILPGRRHSLESPGKRAAVIVRQNILLRPEGEAEEHVNRVLETLAQELERELG